MASAKMEITQLVIPAGFLVFYYFFFVPPTVKSQTKSKINTAGKQIQSSETAGKTPPRFK